MRMDLGINQALTSGCHRPCTCCWVSMTQFPIVSRADRFSLMHFSLVLNRLYQRIQAMRDRNRINLLLHQLDTSEFGGLGPLHNHFWSDEEIQSIFRVKATDDAIRAHITSILCEIYNEDIKTYEQVPTAVQRFKTTLERKIRRIFDRTTWGVSELVLLHRALEHPRNTNSKLKGEVECENGEDYETDPDNDLPPPVLQDRLQGSSCHSERSPVPEHESLE